jgi:formylglycine-generating enzyme required for sulfatase activity
MQNESPKKDLIRVKKDYLELLHQKYEIAYKQLGKTLNDIDKPSIQKTIKDLELEITQLEAEINNLELRLSQTKRLYLPEEVEVLSREKIEAAARLLITTYIKDLPPTNPFKTNINLQSFYFEVASVVFKSLIEKWLSSQSLTIRKSSQQAWNFIEDLGNGVQLEMVQIPQGRFLMGSPEDELDRTADEGPQHQVSVPAFFMGKYPVTQAQWKTVANLPQVNRELQPDPSSFKGANRPVERVSWYDAVEFCARLSQKTGRSYRLPSEAEWEYACRAGTTTPFHFGETMTTDLANYDGTDDKDGKWSGSYGQGPKGVYRQETTPVGSFGVANAFGLYDMHGNVWEWCADPWHDRYEGAPIDGTVWDETCNDNRYQSSIDLLVNTKEDNRTRLLRGGSWYDSPTTSSVFELSVLLRGLNSSLHFYPLALYTS